MIAYTSSSDQLKMSSIWLCLNETSRLFRGRSHFELSQQPQN